MKFNPTLRCWLDHSGLHSTRLHERLFLRSVNGAHLQLDKLVTKGKQPNDKLWLWTAVAASSKLISIGVWLTTIFPGLIAPCALVFVDPVATVSALPPWLLV